MLALLGKKRSKRIALIDSEGLSIFVLYKGQLLHDAKFSDESIGHDNFRNYLSERSRSPITLLVDSVAEDFLVESLPHVSYYDRAGFLNRKSEGHFRGLDYRSSSIVGRDKSGRKDDKVLFSALTKNQILEPWVRVLLMEEIPIQGVTTPAFALCKVAEHHKLLTSKDTLLVNWEKTGIRQTFISNKRMMFSRLTQVAGDDGLAEEIMESCIQSKDYIERIGLLKFDQRLDLQIITPQLQDADFVEFAQGGNFYSISHHRASEFIPEEAYHGDDNSKTAVLLCLDWGVRSGQLANRYAPPPVQRFYDLGQVRGVIMATCAASLLISSGVSLPLLLDANDRRGRIAELQQEIDPIRTQYDALTAEFPETPIPSEGMELAVNTYQLIESQVRNPVDLMQVVSEVVGRFPAVRLSTLQWSLGAAEDVSLTEALLEGEARASLNLIGTMSGGNSIANSQRQLGIFLQALNAIQGATASPISSPVESGPEGEVSTVINDEAVDAEFAISVRMDS